MNKVAMHACNLVMYVIILLSGTTTDGEFCSLRSRGETMAIHIWQLIHDAKESIQRKGKATLLKMLLATGCE